VRIVKGAVGQCETTWWGLTSPVEGKGDSRRHHCAIVDDRAQEVEAERYLFLSVVDSGQDVVLVRHRRHGGIVPGRSYGHWKVHDEVLRVQLVVGQLGRSWVDGMHEDDEWASERRRYCRS